MSELGRAIAELPAFSRIDAREIVSDLSRLLDRNRAEIEKLLDETDSITWDTFVAPFENIGDRLSRFWSPIGHLHGVADNEALRAAYSECMPLLTEYASELAQSDRLFKVFRELRDNQAFAALEDGQRKVIENALRDFRLGGIDLDTDKRARFREISTELSNLTTRFSENVLDATQAWHKHVDAAALTGVPDSALDLARHNARKEGKDGYMLTLDFPCYMPVMSYCDNRELREELYAAYVTRASNQGSHAKKYDNSDNIDKILALRHELAQLLGFDHYADYSLATKMAESTEAVIGFLEDLAERSLGSAQKDYNALVEFAREQLDLDTLEPWDVAYCSEKLRERSFSFSQEELRPYFPVERVVSGLFDTVRRLFDISVEPMNDVDRWHPDVRVYRIEDNGGNHRGIFYLDLFAREHKRGGAWMDECIVRRREGDILHTPAAYLTCNFTPPVGGEQSLLTHDEVLTLFHEFGHGIHHMLTLVDYAPVSGINGVPWDGVELPSQFLENWVWQREALETISGHVESSEPLPAVLFERMIAAKNFQSGMQMVRQLEFALFDMRIHAEFAGGLSVQTILDQVRAKVAVVKAPAYNQFQHAFSHIFAGGYAAGYYSYKWAEVLSADAFSRFEQEGVFNPQTGTSFRECILERGGAEDTMTLFERFRGRSPEIAPLLKQAGLSA